jgi:hypothetical protein
LQDIKKSIGLKTNELIILLLRIFSY